MTAAVRQQLMERIEECVSTRQRPVPFRLPRQHPWGAAFERSELCGDGAGWAALSLEALHELRVSAGAPCEPGGAREAQADGAAAAARIFQPPTGRRLEGAAEDAAAPFSIPRSGGGYGFSARAASFMADEGGYRWEVRAFVPRERSRKLFDAHMIRTGDGTTDKIVLEGVELTFRAAARAPGAIVCAVTDAGEPGRCAAYARFLVFHLGGEGEVVEVQLQRALAPSAAMPSTVYSGASRSAPSALNS